MKMLPFDINLAKAGHPICTRNGATAKFIAHIPECGPLHRLLAHVEGHTYVNDYCENGQLVECSIDGDDLFLIAPKPRELWVNLYDDGTYGSWFKSKHEADEYNKDAFVKRIACLSFVEGQGLEEGK